MVLKAIFKATAVSSGIIGMISLTGCSTNPNLVQVDKVKVESVNSSSAMITRAYLQTTQTAKILRGELKHRFSGRGPIPGHLHIELLGPDGEVFKETQIGYKRKRSSSRIAVLFLPIPNELTNDISSLRVIHHDLRSHTDDLTKPQWRSVSQQTI